MAKFEIAGNEQKEEPTLVIRLIQDGNAIRVRAKEKGCPAEYTIARINESGLARYHHFAFGME